MGGGILEYILSILKSRDKLTYNHCVRVSNYAVKLATITESYRFKSQDIKTIGKAAMLHDIGKLMISLDLLNKTTGLTEVEYAEIKKHTKYGWAMFNSLLDPYEIDPNKYEIYKAAILNHHERPDGHGYPYGKVIEDKSEHCNKYDIVTEIVTICDSYDAITSKRTYNTPLKPCDALTILQSKAGTQFNTLLTKEFIKIIYDI